MANWIDRRALIEQNLRTAKVVWQSAKSAIDECCESYRTNFIGLAQLMNAEQNGHRILLSLRFFQQPNNPRQVSILFSEPEKEIRVTIDGGKAAVFPIHADDKHAFISYQDKELTPDQFTQVALEEALFDPPKEKSRSQKTTSESAWG